MARKKNANGKAATAGIKTHSEARTNPNWFTWFAWKIAHISGKPAVFLTALAAVVIAWAATGPIFGYSDTWQLVINTSTTIVTFLMVFLIQNTQNRDTMALQVKLDELIFVMRGAQNRIAGSGGHVRRGAGTAARAISQARRSSAGLAERSAGNQNRTRTAKRRAIVVTCVISGRPDKRTSSGRSARCGGSCRDSRASDKPCLHDHRPGRNAGNRRARRRCGGDREATSRRPQLHPAEPAGSTVRASRPAHSALPPRPAMVDARRFGESRARLSASQT